MYALRKRTKIAKHSSEFFHMVIVGRSGCGKTMLLTKLLKTELFRQFNAIFLICPTFAKNASYDSFYTDDKFYVLPGSTDCLESNIAQAREEASKYYRSLIILDDVIGNKTMVSRASNYVSLLTGGRHDGISTITLTQQLNSIAKVSRDQFRIITFYNPDGDDRKIMFGKYLCDVKKEELNRAIQFLRTKDYGYMDINILKGNFTLH